LAARFRHEDVSAVPKGWRVRTVTHERHRVRVAFPPGRREKGSGRLVSILHPVGENPCTLRSANPAELLVMGANPPRRRNPEAVHARRATEAWARGFADGTHGRKARKLPQHLMSWQKDYDKGYTVGQQRRANPGMELVVMGANPPHVHTAAPGVTAEAEREANNPPAAEIFEQFTGRPSEWVSIEHEPCVPRGDYAQLGYLLNLYVKPAGGGQVLELRFRNSKPLVVCDRSARQIYFVGGDQDITESIDRFKALAIPGGDPFRCVLGEGVRIDYQARKDHVAEPDEDKWKHYFGEEDGAKPKVLFDSRHKRLLLDGGDYRIDGAWIRN
jgi:hypothetical protein